MAVSASGLDWLLDPANPGVRLRALTQLCGLPVEHPEVRAARRTVLGWLPAAQDLSWMDSTSHLVIYDPLALAECGLTREDIDITPLVDRLLASSFDSSCGDMIVLRALVMLGYAHDPRVQARLTQVGDRQLPDGGWFCAHRLQKMKRIPKSCYKADMHALLLASELRRRDIQPAWVSGLVQYFLKRRVFYRTDQPAELVTGGRPGWRVIDVFMPLEVMRIGLPHFVEALAVLGAGRAPEACEAWQILESKRDAQGRVRLEGTLTRSYLPKEPVGKPSRWATLYTALAYQALGKERFD